MRKIVVLVLFIMTFLLTTYKACAMSFEEGFNQINEKPLMVFVYAPWIDEIETYNSVYKQLKQNWSGKYNIVVMNAASGDLKLFNKYFQLYTNLPYMLIFKDSIKLSRYIPRECLKDYACVESRVKTFLD